MTKQGIDPLEVIVAFLSEALSEIATVHRATPTGLPATGTLPATVVIDLAGGPADDTLPILSQRATLMCYGPDPLALYRDLYALAINPATGTPFPPRRIRDTWTLRRFIIGTPVGPLVEPETERERVDLASVFVLHSLEDAP